MSFKKKFENFWYYYKNHTIIAIISLIFLSYFYMSGKDNTLSSCNILLLSSNNPFESSSLKDDIDDFINEDNNKYEVKINFLPFDIENPNSQVNIQAYQALSVWMLAKDVDIFIADKDVIYSYSIQDDEKNSSVFAPLDEYAKEGMNYIKSVDNSVIAINILDTKLRNLNFYDKSLYISIISNGSNLKNSAKVMSFLLK